MAVVSLQAESVCANPTFEALYAAYRHAKAKWDLDSYAPEYLADGVPEELEEAHCTAFSAALNAFLLHPAQSAKELSKKLRVYRDEEIFAGWHAAKEITSALADDADRVAKR